MIMDEESLISLVIERTQRSRYRTGLANPKKRYRLLGHSNHRPALDVRWTTWYSTFTKALAKISVSPSTVVYLLSADEELDGLCMPFHEAIEAVQMAGWGTIIGINPELALYYGECGERAAVICKDIDP